MIEAVNVEAMAAAARFAERRASVAAERAADAASATRFFSHGAWRDADVFLREHLSLGAAGRPAPR